LITNAYFNLKILIKIIAKITNGMIKPVEPSVEIKAINKANSIVMKGILT